MCQHNSNQVSSKEVEKAEQQYHLGLEFLKKQKPNEAIRFLNAAVELNPSHEEAQTALRGASEGLNWNRAYFCEECGGFVKPEKDYPLIKFDGVCQRCGQTVSTRFERTIGNAELFTKILLFGMFPAATLIFAVIPMWISRSGAFILDLPPLLSAIPTGMSLTPFFFVLLSTLDPTGTLLDQMYYGIFESIQPLETIHPLLFLAAETVILFAAIYLCLLFLFTPTFYIHRKGFWKNKKRQKTLLLITSMCIVIVVLWRLSVGKF